MKRSELNELADQAYELLSESDNDTAALRAVALLKNAPHEALSYLLLAEVAEDKGQYDLALNAVNQGLKLHPEDEALLLKKASIFFDGFEDLDEAFDILSTLERKFSEYSIESIKKNFDSELLLDIYLLLIDCYRLKNDFNNAFNIAIRCRDLNRDDELALLALATGHFELGDYKKALSLIEPLNHREPADFWWLKGLIFCAMGDTAKADDAFLEAKKLDRNKYHRPLRLSETEFRAHFDLATASLPREIRDFLQDVPLGFFEYADGQLVKQSRGTLSPLACIFWGEIEGQKKLMIFRRNIENLCLRKDQIKDVIASAILHELGKVVVTCK